MRGSSHNDLRQYSPGCQDILTLWVFNASPLLDTMFKDTCQASFVEYDPDKLSDKRKQLKNEEKKYTLSKADSQQSAANSVLALIDRLVQNLQTEITEAQGDEAKAQTDFEKESKLLETTKAKLSKKIASIEGMLATHSGSKKDAELAQTGTQTDLKAQKDYKASIQEPCLLTPFFK